MPLHVHDSDQSIRKKSLSGYVQEGFVDNSGGEYRGVVECDGGGFVLQKIPSGMLLTIGLGTGYKQTIRMAMCPVLAARVTT